MKWIAVLITYLFMGIRLLFYVLGYLSVKFVTFLWAFKASDMPSWKKWSTNDWDNGEQSPFQTYKNG